MIKTILTIDFGHVHFFALYVETFSFDICAHIYLRFLLTIIFTVYFFPSRNVTQYKHIPLFEYVNIETNSSIKHNCR